ncbi:hypothetical protein NIES4071_25310 [Calothrix sp. NIES-4071]|nr:hypothetical protein NIES4071_25310 [Calothrix sp. NIES-4071]BAZ56854.1 hypothetical protein NIES4105_25250 [Calothrix sp. NIES-4105]
MWENQCKTYPPNPLSLEGKGKNIRTDPCRRGVGGEVFNMQMNCQSILPPPRVIVLDLP